MSELTRSDFLLRAAGTGGAALATGAAVGWLAAPAAAAPTEQELAWVRFAITAEVVSAEFYRQARRTGVFSRKETRALERATAAQNAHLARFRQTLMEAGHAPIDAADLEVVFPDGAFASRTSVVSLGRRVGALCLHSYLGALVTIQDPTVRRVFAQVCASEAEQLAFLTGLAAPVITDPFPSVHGLATAADELARYLP